jgi:putative thioredoxin
LNPFIVDVDEAGFEDQVVMRSHQVPIVVDFWADWCGPCKILGPLLERLAIEAGGTFILARVDVDANPGLSIRFGVQGIPAVKAFQKGEVVSEFVGAQPEPVVRRFIERLVPDEDQQAVEAANSLLATRHYPEAESAFQDIFDENETNAAAALGLMKSLLLQGRGSDTLEIWHRFPSGVEWAQAEELVPMATWLEGADAESEPADAREAEWRQAARLIKLGNFPAAMDGLLDLLRQDKTYRDGAAKQTMLAIFALLGDDDPTTRQYRDELASILF